MERVQSVYAFVRNECAVSAMNEHGIPADGIGQHSISRASFSTFEIQLAATGSSSTPEVTSSSIRSGSRYPGRKVTSRID